MNPDPVASPGSNVAGRCGVRLKPNVVWTTLISFYYQGKPFKRQRLGAMTNG